MRFPQSPINFGLIGYWLYSCMAWVAIVLLAMVLYPLWWAEDLRYSLTHFTKR